MYQSICNFHQPTIDKQPFTKQTKIKQTTTSQPVNTPKNQPNNLYQSNQAANTKY
jgi:hypothetical protein